LNVKVTQRSKVNALCTPTTPPSATEWNALAENNVTQQQMAPFRRCRGVISAACVRFMFVKTSLALVFTLLNFKTDFKNIGKGVLIALDAFEASNTCTR